MPGRRKKKPFINRKSAITFNLVHRSQTDPLQADEDAPQRVLVPLQNTDSNLTENSSKGDSSVQLRKKRKRREEQIKYGIYFDDDYDYLQHLKDVSELQESEPIEIHGSSLHSEGLSLKLPSSVFESKEHTTVGLLNKAAPCSDPKIDWDPDIVELLDDDVEPTNDLQDEFVSIANENSTEVYTKSSSFFDDDSEFDSNATLTDNDTQSDVSSDNVQSLSDKFSFDSEENQSDPEKKTVFTNYSLTSSVVPRNKGLQLVDDQFEDFFESYADEEMGSLDQEDIDGQLKPSSERILNLLEEFEKSATTASIPREIDSDFNIDTNVMLENFQNIADSTAENEIPFLDADVPQSKEDKIDCESIISTYSNIFNHPTKIIEEKKRQQKRHNDTKKDKSHDSISPELPSLTYKEICKETGLSTKGIVGSVVLNASIQPRKRKETTEEKHARKSAIKDERRERRLEKKANKLAFKTEKLKYKMQRLNIQLNQPGVQVT